MAELSQQEIERIARTAAEAVRKEIARANARSGFDEATHAAHHQWVADQISRQHGFSRMRWRVSEYVVGSLAVLALVGFVGFVGHAAIQSLKALVPEVAP